MFYSNTDIDKIIDHYKRKLNDIRDDVKALRENNVHYIRKHKIHLHTTVQSKILVFHLVQ